MDHLVTSFRINKIDDICAKYVETQKLSSMGLAYGDIIVYQQVFQNTDNKTQYSYTQRVEELKSKRKKVHTNRVNPTHKISKTCDVIVGLKCKEPVSKSKIEKYVLKHGKGFEFTTPKATEYDELHTIIRKHYKIPEKYSTFIGKCVILKLYLRQAICVNKFRKMKYFFYNFTQLAITCQKSAK